MTGSFIREIGNVKQRKLPTEPETVLSPQRQLIVMVSNLM